MINSRHRCPLLVLPVKVTGALPRRYQQNTQGAARLCWETSKQLLLKNSLFEHDKILRPVFFRGLFENESCCYCGDGLFGFSPRSGPVLWWLGCLLWKARRKYLLGLRGGCFGAVSVARNSALL